MGVERSTPEDAVPLLLGFTDQESRLMLNQAIVNGRGGLFLNLTAEQFSKLKHSGK